MSEDLHTWFYPQEAYEIAFAKPTDHILRCMFQELLLQRQLFTPQKIFGSFTACRIPSQIYRYEYWIREVIAQIEKVRREEEEEKQEEEERIDHR